MKKKIVTTTSMYLPIYAAPVTHCWEQNLRCSMSSDWSSPFASISLECMCNMALFETPSA